MADVGGDKPQKSIARAKPIWLVLYMVAPALSTVMIRYLSLPGNFGDTLSGNFTMNFYRFLAGSLAMLLICYFVCRDDLKRVIRNARQLAGLAVFALVTTVFQTLFVQGIAQTSAAMGQLMTILGLPLAIFLAVLVYSDERAMVKGSRFIVGAVLALGGAVAVTFSKEDLTLKYSLGSLYLFIAAVIWSASALVKKKLVADSHPLCTASLYLSFMCIFFFLACLVRGDLGKVGELETLPLVILPVSGVYGLGMGMGFNFVIIRLFGIVKAGIGELAWPVFAGLYGYLILGEFFDSWQMVFGAAVLAGCYLVVTGRARLGRRDEDLA